MEQERFGGSIMINHEKLQKIEEAYLGYLPDYWSGESYKWKAIKQFQDHWDIEASDFAAMLEQALAKTYNLLASGYYYAKAMLLGFAGEDPMACGRLFAFCMTKHEISPSGSSVSLRMQMIESRITTSPVGRTIIRTLMRSAYTYGSGIRINTISTNTER